MYIPLFNGFIDVKEIDALVFNMGGIVIQLIGLDVPSTFCARKLILCCTGPGSEADMVHKPNMTGALKHSGAKYEAATNANPVLSYNVRGRRCCL